MLASSFTRAQRELQEKKKKASAKLLYSLTARSKNPKNIFAILPTEVTKNIFMKYYVELLQYGLRGWVKVHFDKIDLKHLCANKSLEAMEIIKEASEAIPDNLDWYELSKNPFAIDILSLPENYERLEWSALSSNKEAIALLDAELIKNPGENKIDWGELSINEKGYAMILQRMAVEDELGEDALDDLRPNKKLDRTGLLANKSTDVLNFLKQPKKTRDNIIKRKRVKSGEDLPAGNSNPIKVLKNLMQPEKTRFGIDESWSYLYWYHLSGNSNPIAISLLEAELKKNPNSPNIDWEALSGNPGAVKLLKAELKRNPDSPKINWKTLSGNAGVGIMEIIRDKIKKDGGNPDDNVHGQNQLDWFNLSSNPKAIFLLRDNQDKIEWDAFSTNPAIFSLDVFGSKEKSSRLPSSSA